MLDNWDPRVVDGIAAQHRVITFDNRGVGASTGKTPDTIQAMASDAVTFIRALGLEQVDLVGFSMGGMIAQVIAQDQPQLVRKLILAGTGPAGGEGITNVTKIAYLDFVRGAFTLQDPKQFLFFTRTANGRPGRQAVPVTVQGAHREPRQGDLDPGLPHATQGDPPLGPGCAGRPVRHPSARAGGQR